jgi:hypothetical protein
LTCQPRKRHSWPRRRSRSPSLQRSQPSRRHHSRHHCPNTGRPCFGVSFSVSVHLEQSPDWVWVSHHSATSRLPLAEGRPALAVQGDSHAGKVLPVVVQRYVDDRRHPGALRDVVTDGQALKPGRARQLRLLRPVLPLVLGTEAVPGVFRRGDAIRGT